MNKSTWECCGVPGSVRCRDKISRLEQRIVELMDEVEWWKTHAELPTTPRSKELTEIVNAHRHGGELGDLSVKLPEVPEA